MRRDIQLHPPRRATPALAAMTYAALTPELAELQRSPSLVAVAAWQGRRPLGLALGRVGPGPALARVLSLYVHPEHRRRGLGAELFAALEARLVHRGVRRLETKYVAERPGARAVERIIARRRWSSPLASMLICKAGRDILRSPLAALELPPELTTFPWGELSDGDRRQLVAASAQPGCWYPPSLSPFHHDPLDLQLSLGLRRGGEVVGWILNHRLSPELLRFSRMFVRTEHQGMARGVALVAAAMRKAGEAGIQRAIFAVKCSNTAMVSLVRRRLAPYLSSIEQSMHADKELRRG